MSMTGDPMHDLHDIAQEHNSVVALERLTHHIQRIREAQDRTEKSVSQIADALTRLAIVEERQSNTNGAIDKLTTAIEGLDARLKTLELLSPASNRMAALVDKVIWLVAGGSVMYFVEKVMHS